MIIKQEETSKIQDAFDKTHLYTAFNGISTMAGDIAVDTELFKTYCEESIKLLKKLITDIEAIERDTQKKSHQEHFRDKLFGQDSLG